MPVHIVLQPGIARRVGAHQVVQRERRRVRQDDPVPDHLNPALPVADPAVVFAQNARALRDQQELARGRVIDRLRHRGDHVARQIRLDARHQRTGDHRPRHHLVRRSRHLQIGGIPGGCQTAFEERLLLLLPVLHSRRIGRLGRRDRHRRQRIQPGQCTAQTHHRWPCLIRRRSTLALTSRAKKHRRSRSRLSLLAQGILGIMARGRIGGHGRLLRGHDGGP